MTQPRLETPWLYVLHTMEINPYKLFSNRHGMVIVKPSIDGKYLICIVRKHYIKIVNTLTGTELDRKSITLGVCHIVCARMSPDNTKIACIASNDYFKPTQYEFILYDIVKGCVVNRYDINNNRTRYTLAYSTNGKYIAVVCMKKILVCCGNSGDIISTHEEPNRPSGLIWSVFFSTDNSSLIIEYGDYIIIWDVIFKRVLSKKRDSPDCVTLSPDLTHYTKYLQFEKKIEMKNALNGDFSFILSNKTHAGYSYTGKHLLTRENGTLCIHNSENGSIYFQTPVFSRTKGGTVLYSHMCINNRYITIYTSHGYIYTYDMHGRWAPSRYLQFNESYQRLSLYTWILAQKLQFERMDLPILPTEIWILIISLYWYIDVLL